MEAPILMTEDYWSSNHFSIVRYTGGVQAFGQSYLIVDKFGRDVYECSEIAEKEGRTKAIEPGEPCDLVDVRYIPVYRKLGRDEFMKWLGNPNISHSVKDAKIYASKK